MGGDAEKRLEKVMDKLYHAPRIPAGGGRRTAAAAVRGGMERRLRAPPAPALGPAPSCRPWDRADLLRRLATFKAMTWFCKPKVVSPVNCARRGWINIEMDTIVCEACEARLFFSTPSSWTLQQVENAAAVFSLKLDNGHKLLCPWINNACDEALALFPPMPPPALVEGYRERSSALLQLSALPFISSLAIDYMKNPQLEHFLSQSPHLSITLGNGVRLTDGCGSKDLEGVSEAGAATLYYQALKIISLCGWEPRMLSYVVDYEDHSRPAAKDAHPSGSSVQIHSEKNRGIIVYSSDSSGDVEKGMDDHRNLHESQCDPPSVVLDCRLCGACVGLWAFATIPRPLEIFTLVPSSDSSGQGVPDTSHTELIGRIEAPRTENLDSENKDSDKRIANAGYNSITAKDRYLGLNLTIAGGPPPTKQNFKPRVSFSVISRHLRAHLASSSTVKKSVPSHICCRDQSDILCSQNDKLSQQPKDINVGLIVHPESAESLKRKRIEYGLEEGNHNLSSDLENSEKRGNTFSVDRNYTTQEPSSLHEANGGDESLGELMLDKTEEPLVTVREDGNGVKVGENQCTNSEADITIMDSGAYENNYVTGSADADSLNQSGTSASNHHDSSNIASCSATDATLSSISGTELEKSKTNDSKNIARYFVNKESDVHHASGNNSRAILYDKSDEFDPIRQHRTFCPWIVAMDGKSAPGWKLVLSALCHQDKDSSQPPHTEVQASFLDEADDPIVSVRKLFMSPTAKRAKIGPMIL